MKSASDKYYMYTQANSERLYTVVD